MYGAFVAAMLAAAGRPFGEREGAWYDAHIKAHEYGGMTAVTREIRSHGCPVLLSAPFTEQLHDPNRWGALVDESGGEPVRLVWVRADVDSLRQRLESRQSPRDTEKRAGFDEFVARMQPDSEPAVEHITIDNRVSATTSVTTQLKRALRTTT